MKTFYWSLVLMMLLPSMAYTQNTEKENEFLDVDANQTSGGVSERSLGFLAMKGESRIVSSTIVPVCQLTKRSDLEIKMSAQHVGVWGQDPQIDKNGRFVLNEAWAKLDFGHGLFCPVGASGIGL